MDAELAALYDKDTDVYVRNEYSIGLSGHDWNRSTDDHYRYIPLT